MSNGIFNFNFLALLLSEILGGPKFTLGGPVPPSTPPSTLLCLMAFSISTFQLLYFPRYQGGPKFTLGGPTRPGRPLAENFFYPISNCVFNFNILALVVSDILGGSQIYVRGPCAPLYAHSGKIFAPEASTLLCLMAFSISTFQLLYFPRYQGGPKFTLGGPTPPSGEIFLPKASTSQYLIVFLISIFQHQQFPRFQGVPNLRYGALCTPLRPLAKFFLYPRREPQYV